MITQLKVSRFRSLGHDVCLPLGPLVALVGPNGSGKSSVLDAFQFVSDCLRLGLEGAITKRHGITAVRHWSSGRPYDVTFDVSARGDSFAGSYSFTLGGATGVEYQVKSETAMLRTEEGTERYAVHDGTWRHGPTELRPKLDRRGLALPLVAGDRRFKPLADALRDIAVYSISPDVLREPHKYDPARPMDRLGSNWASILRSMEEATWKPDLVACLAKLTGDVEDVRVRPTRGYGYLHVEFEHRAEDRRPRGQHDGPLGPEGTKHVRRGKWFDAAQESDGTLRVAGIVTALLQDPTLTVIAVEEPELTVHPGALSLLYDFLRQATRRTQVILTTHSPDFLDQLDPDEVRVVTRRSGETIVSPMTDEQRQAVRTGLLTPFPAAAVLFKCEYEVLFLPCVHRMAGRPIRDDSGVERPGLLPDARFDGDPETIRDVKGWLTRRFPAGVAYKPSLDQLPLTRRIDFEAVRAAAVPCFGTLERALRFLSTADAGQVYPASSPAKSIPRRP